MIRLLGLALSDSPWGEGGSRSEVLWCCLCPMDSLPSAQCMPHLGTLLSASWMTHAARVLDLKPGGGRKTSLQNQGPDGSEGQDGAR